jgi:hypothetical protein
VSAASVSADGSGDSRSDPAAVWWLMLETSTVLFQDVPPLVLRNERMLPASDSYGTTTSPLGSATGWPPSPVWLPPGASAAPQLAPPLVEVRIQMESPPLVMSYSV